MGKHPPRIKVGDVFSALPDVTLTVVEYVHSTYIVVEDEQHNRKTATALGLRSGKIQWLNLDGSLRQTKGNLYRGPNRKALKQDAVKAEFPVGSVWPSKHHGGFEILEVVNSREVRIRWLSNGYEDSTQAHHIRNVAMRNPTHTMDDLGYYVYVVSQMKTGEILYVGYGKGARFKHTMSGASSSPLLNKFFFTGVPMVCEVLEKGLTKSQAMRREVELVRKYKPAANSHHFMQSKLDENYLQINSN